jgi:hypothetical protein
MKKYALTCFARVCCTLCFAQSYLGRTKSPTPLRPSASIRTKGITNLTNSTQIFIISLKEYNGFYNVIDIATNREGYVAKSAIMVGQQVIESERGIFSPSGSSTGSAPEVEIYNNTSLTLTLKLNRNLYSFSPQSKRTITLSIGDCYFRASAPGVIPNIGTETVESNRAYTWQFYISKRRR